ncbi:MAG: serine hydrolase [Flavobacteriia bacterium]
MKKMIYLMVMGIAMLQTVEAQTVSPNLSTLLQIKLDSLVNIFAGTGNTKGVSIGIFCPGEGYWTGVSGISHPGVNLTPDMKQGLASNSKLFIGVTMLKLDEQQIIDLDSPISTWLDPIPNVNPAITVRQLLNHTSGIEDPFFSTSLLDSINAHPTHEFSSAEVFSYLGAALFPAGTSYSYSNINYILAGMIAEEATGQTMAQLVRQNIFTPLNLNNTFYDYGEAEITPLAHRWHDHVDYHDTSRVSLNSAGGPAGAIFSTAADMAHWYHALMDGQVLSQSSFDELTNFVDFDGIGNYGLGIQRTNFYDRENWGHGGSTHGYKSRSVYDPCSSAVVCGLSNDDWSAIDGITVLMYKALIDYLPACSLASEELSNEKQSFKVFPNPATNEVVIEFLGNDENATFTLTNMLNQAVLKGNLRQNTTLEIGNLNAGIYMISVENEGQIFTKRIVKR